jgi:hypothetical protein
MTLTLTDLEAVALDDLGEEVLKVKGDLLAPCLRALDEEGGQVVAHLHRHTVHMLLLLVLLQNQCQGQAKVKITLFITKEQLHGYVVAEWISCLTRLTFISL